MGADTVDVESVPQPTNGDDIGTTRTDSTDFEPVPEKRKKRARWASLFICAITAISVIAFSSVNGTVDEYKLDTTQGNATNNCYVKERKITLPGLFTAALSLFGIVLGTLVDRLTLVAEECYHRHRRYGGSYKKMFKACFSGISWGPVIVLIVLAAAIDVLLIHFTNKPWFELSYFVYIFGGIGVGPLIMLLLKLNTQSEVHISTILEEKGMYVANGLAWSYYFNNLSQALPEFKETISQPLPLPAPYQHVKLSLNKLLLLIPHDCHVQNLNELDKNIIQLPDTGNYQTAVRFPIYRFTDNEDKHCYFAMQYVKEPLNTLREMSLLEETPAVKKQDCEKEVQLLYRTLHEILSDPPNQHFKGMCILVPIKANNSEDLKNGGLVRCIMEVVQPTSKTRVDGARGFVKPKELTVDVSSSSKATTSNAQTVIWDLDSNPRLTHKVTINDDHQGKGKKTDPGTRNKRHDGEVKGKTTRPLKRKYKDEKPTDIELKELIAAENHDSTECKPNDVQQKPKVQESVGGNDIGASTSENSTQMVNNEDESQPGINQPQQSNEDE